MLACASAFRESGGSAGTRTRDLSIKSRLLYRLSYGPDRRLLLWTGRGRVNRAAHCRTVPRPGIRQSGAIRTTESSANRLRMSCGCGMLRPALDQRPPDHSRISRSSTRSPQRFPRRRPKSRSICLSAFSRAMGGRGVSSSIAALAKRRRDGPMGAVCVIGDVAMGPSNRMAPTSTSAGRPWR